MRSIDARELIQEYTDAVWNQGDVGAMERYYPPDYVHHDASRPDVTSLEDYRRWAEELMAGIHELHVEIDDLIAEDGKAVKRWTARGVHRGELAGIAPTGRRVAFSGVSTYRLENGRIVESWYLYDLFGLLQQLAAIPAAESEAKAPA